MLIFVHIRWRIFYFYIKVKENGKSGGPRISLTQVGGGGGRGGGSGVGERQYIILAIFPNNFVKLKKNLAGGGGRFKILLCRSATRIENLKFKLTRDFTDFTGRGAIALNNSSCLITTTQ